MAECTTDESRWDALREPIRTMYLLENRGLEEVRHAMEAEHGLIGTKYQYEKHFEKWGLRKNMTKDEWHAVTYAVQKRKRDGKDSEVCLDYVPMNPKKVRKAMLRYGSASTALSRATSPSLPEGIVVHTPAATPTDLARMEESGTNPCLGQTLDNPMMALLLGPLPFMEFRSLLDNEGTPHAGRTWSFGPNTITNFHELQTSVITHFKGSLNRSDATNLPRSRLRGLMPDEMLCSVNMHSQTRDSPHEPMSMVEFRNLTLFMMSNKVISANLDIGVKIYSWIKHHSDSGALTQMLSLSGLTAGSLSEQLAFVAIENSDAEMLEKILDLGLHPRELRYRDKYLKLSTPLQRACDLPSLDVVRVLLDRGAGVNTSTADRPSPLCCAINSRRHGHPIEDVIKRVQLLLGAGANAQEPGNGPLMAATSCFEPELVKILLSAGANPNAPGQSGTTPLMNVMEDVKSPIHIGVLPVVQLLLQAGACVNCEDDYGTTTLVAAILTHDNDTIQLLLEKGALVTEEALKEAARNSQPDIVKLLLQFGAKVTQEVLDDFLEFLDECEFELEADGEDFATFLLLYEAAESKQREELREFALIVSISCGNTTLVRDLSLSSVEFKNRSKLASALERAAERGDIETFHILISHDSPCREIFVASSATALCSSICNEENELTEFLLAAGADTNASDSETGKTPLYCTIDMGNTGLASRLLAAGALVNFRTLSQKLAKKCGNLASEYTGSVLPAAAKWGDVAFIDNLIRVGADVNGLEPGSGKTALTVAVEKGFYGTVELLIAAGADINSPIARFLGQAALTAAVQKDDLVAIRYLLMMGADPDEYALMRAIGKNQEVLKILLAATLKRYSRLPKGFGSRALQCATKRSDFIAIQMLLSKGVDLNAIVRYHYDHCSDLWHVFYIGERHCSAFSTALNYDKSEGFWIVKAFLSAGANPNHLISEKCGRIPLLLAIARNSLCLVKLVIDAGADVNLRKNAKTSPTPLQSAAELGNMEILGLLLEQGADVNAPAGHESGATALQYASMKGHLGVVLALLERGADVDAAPTKLNGRTALEGASEHGRTDVLSTLLHAGAKLIGPGSAQYALARNKATENGHITVPNHLDAHRDKQQAEHEAANSTML